MRFGAALRDKLTNRKIGIRRSRFAFLRIGRYLHTANACVWDVARLCGWAAGGGLGGMPALRIAFAHIGCLNATRYGAFLTQDCGM